MKRFLLILLAATLSGMAILIVGLTGFAVAEGVGEIIQPDKTGALSNWSDYIFLGVFLLCIPTGLYALILAITLSCSRWLRSSRLRAWGFSLLLTASFLIGILVWSLQPWRTGWADLHYGRLPLSWNLIMALSGLAGTEVALWITRMNPRRREAAPADSLSAPDASSGSPPQ